MLTRQQITRGKAVVEEKGKVKAVVVEKSKGKALVVKKTRKAVEIKVTLWEKIGVRGRLW